MTKRERIKTIEDLKKRLHEKTIDLTKCIIEMSSIRCGYEKVIPGYIDNEFKASGNAAREEIFKMEKLLNDSNFYLNQ